MNKKFTILTAAFALLMALSIPLTGWGQTKSEGDTHDFAQTLQAQLNNNASINPINIAEQSYPVKKVTVSYRYNKDITNAVTIEVTVGGTSWGTESVTNTGQNYATLDFEGTSTTGAIVVSFTNNTGSGTGHGTLWVNNVRLTEGSSGGGSTDPEIQIPAEELALANTANNSGSFNVTYTNDYECGYAEAHLFYDSECNNAFPTSGDDAWISLEEMDDPWNVINYSVLANTVSTERTVYMKVEALDNDNNDIEGVFTITQAGAPTVATPAFSPAAGAVAAGTTVSISCATSGATIYYTTNGDTPTTSSTVYSSAITVNDAMTIKAIAVKENYINSVVAVAAYTIIVPVTGYGIDFESELNTYSDWTFTNIARNTTTINAHGGTYYGRNANGNGNATTTASIKTANKVATPYILTCYVSKESTNTTTSKWYIQVSENGSTWTDVAETDAKDMSKGVWKEFTADLSAYTNVFVRVYYSGSAAFRTIDDLTLSTDVPAPAVAKPEFTPASGTEFGNNGLDVTITCETTNSTIYYTLDGSTPDNQSTLYSGAIHLTETTTVKAIAYVGTDASAVATATYTYVDPNGLGTRNNPYTVAQAKALMSGWSNGQKSSGNVYVSGIISEVTSYSSTYYSITYNISDDGGSTSFLKVYGGKGINGADFASDEDLYAGDQVIVKGELYKFNSSTDEINTNSILVLHAYSYTSGEVECHKVIEKYSGEGGYYLIATPVDDQEPTTSMTTGDFDLYRFNEASTKEWENWKDESNYHFNLYVGKGYLYANSASDNTVITVSGTPTTDYTTTLSKTSGAEFEGMNLVGNPLGVNAYIDRPFYIMNSTGTELVAATRDNIFPMEGVFVSASKYEEELEFSATAPNSGNTDLVVNVNAGNKMLDRAVVRFNAGGMLPKFQLNQNSTKVFIPQGSKDFAVVNSANEGEMPVSFKAENNGTYTLSVNAENVDMNYLHLIDNKTGADIDLLATPSYSFEAKTSDYASRFRLVFSANEGSNENGNETFAYYNGSEWVINNMGDATLQVVDVMGRVLSSETVSGNATLSTSNLSAGVYVMRLINGENAMTQKIVVR